jgi:hypothetical protein
MIKLPSEASSGLPAPVEKQTIDYTPKQLPDR